MADYLFYTINNGVTIQNPTITVSDVIDKRNGTALVYAFIVKDNVSFKVALDSLFTYTGDQPMKADIDTWFAIQIQNYIVP